MSDEVLRLVIFDCDGVLIDSEPITNRLVAAELTELGWPMNEEDSRTRFLGMSITDMVPLIEAQLGCHLASDWAHGLETRLVAALAEQAPLIPGAREALDAVSALGLPWRIASNSSHEEMMAKFGRNGLGERVAGRLHSYRDVARGKPAPDLFLAAAAAQGVSPSACVVVEDSVPGVRGARAAGMRCLGYAPDGDGMALAAAGAQPFRSLFDLATLLRAELGQPI